MRVYLDTNIFLEAIKNRPSNSRILFLKCFRGEFEGIVSEYTIDETMDNLKRRAGKDSASMVRELILSVPGIKVVKYSDIKPLIEKYSSFVTDIDDVPHICAYFISHADFFVTNNRKLTQMKIKDKVEFLSPKEFIEKVLDSKGMETKRGH
ncbi:MAG: PIN domain-containing protein [Candidatus Hydrothermarchaeales archaeon]